jgi:hypothetical protein
MIHRAWNVLSFVVLLGCVPHSVSAEGCSEDTPCCGKSIYGLKWDGSHVIIPNNLTSIPAEAFRCCNKFTRITIPGSVKVIGKNIFQGCNNEAPIEVIILEGVETIGCEAFAGPNSNVANVSIPGTVTLIDEGAFNNAALTTVSIAAATDPTVVRTIKKDAFGLNAKLETLSLPKGEFVVEEGNCGLNVAGITFEGGHAILPEGTTSIDARAFAHCRGLKTVDMPKTLTSIGMEAFENCDKLAAIVIPGTVKEVNESAFRECAALATLVIEDGLEDIALQAFRDCTALVAVRFPGSVNAIGSEAFYGCSKLTTVTFSEGLESIADSAFESTKLAGVIFPSTLRFIGEHAFLYSELNAACGAVASTDIDPIAFDDTPFGKAGGSVQLAQRACHRLPADGICPSGRSVAASTALDACLACPAGYYKNGPSTATECHKCPQGKFAPSTNSTSCTQCEWGSYNSLDGEASCTADCKNTDSSFYTISLMCKECTAGRFYDSSGCADCPLSYYQPDLDNHCSECPHGKYQSKNGEAYCDEVHAGSLISWKASETDPDVQTPVQLRCPETGVDCFNDTVKYIGNVWHDPNVLVPHCTEEIPPVCTNFYTCVNNGCPNAGETRMVCKTEYQHDSPLCAICAKVS